MTMTAIKSATTVPTKVEPARIHKRIGSTTFVVTVRFNDKDTETLEDKFLRLIEREVNDVA